MRQRLNRTNKIGEQRGGVVPSPHKRERQRHLQIDDRYDHHAFRAPPSSGAIDPSHAYAMRDEAQNGCFVQAFLDDPRGLQAALKAFVHEAVVEGRRFPSREPNKRCIDQIPYEVGQPPIRGFAINNIPGFWLKNGEVAKDLYVAFTAKSADAVRASYKAAIDAGATSNKEPSLRPEWRADYFAANIGDPDGYNIEIAYKPWLYK